MNYLNIRTPVKMNTIIGEHRDAFEKHVLELYAASVGQGAGFWGCIPSSDALAINVNPSFTLAVVLAEGTDDPAFYIKETKGKVPPELEQMWASAALLEFNNEVPGNVLHAEMGILKDVTAVLDYHKMCFMFQVAVDVENIFDTGLQALRNTPLVQVW